MPSQNIDSVGNKFKIEEVDELTSPRYEIKIPIPSCFLNMVHKMVKDPKDNMMAEFVVNHIFINFIPMLCFFLIPALERWSFVYFFLHVFTMQTTILFVHYVSHIRPWAPGFDILRYYAIIIQIGFVGISPFGYETHHLRMHHGENNSYPGDLSSTEVYERDNFFHWLIYWARFYFGINLELPLWSLRKGHYFQLARNLAWICLYYYFFYFMYTIKPMQTTWCFIVPHAFGGLALMFGNFSQHVFVNPKNYRSSYGLAYNILNTFENQVTWNDSYHLQHHLNSQTKWRDLPSSFLKMQEKIAANGGLTFQKCDFNSLGLWSFLGWTGKIYECFVPLCKEQEMTKEEFSSFIDEWYRPIHDVAHNSIFLWFLAKTSRREPLYVKYTKGGKDTKAA